MSDAKNMTIDHGAASFGGDGSVLKIIHALAVDILAIQSNEDLAWYVARQVVGKLGFADCVVYFMDDDKKLLRQKAAFGEVKNPVSNEIVNVLDIRLGEGVTGQVAKSKKPLIVDDLEKFSGYIADVEPARSEICVPILIEDQVIGVIDCEDRRVGHFNDDHLQLLSTVAAIMSLRLNLIKQGEAAELAKKLAHSEKRFRDIAEATSDWYWETGPDYRYSYVSPQYYGQTGFRPENFIGKERIDFISPRFIEQNPAAWQAHQDDLEHHKPFQNFEYFGEMKDGTQRHVRVSGKPFFDENGAFLGYRGTANSIDEQIKAHQALHASEEKFRDFAESSSDWFWEMGPDLKITYVSDSFRDSPDVDSQVWIGKSRDELAVDREDSEKWRKHLDDLNNRRPFRGFQYLARHTDEINHHEIISGKPIFDDQGSFLGYRGTGRNITAQVEAEKLAAVLMGAIDSLPDLVALYDADENFVFCNKIYLEIMRDVEDMFVPGTPLEVILRASVERGMVRDFVGDPEDWVRDRLSRFRNPREPVLHQQLNGRWVLTYDHKMADGCTFVHRADVTDLMATQKLLENAKEEAELANRTKSEFLANMSHELRTPLNAIIGFSDSIRHEIYGPLANEKYKGYLEDIYGSGQHLLELISDILNVSAIEAGKLELHEENLVIADIFEKTLHLVSGRADDGNIRLISTIDDDSPQIHADKRRLMQILLNLLSNAIKFTQPGGTVTLSAVVDSTNAHVFTVIDTGIGMDQEEMIKAMSAFGQVHFGSSRTHEGTGLGLPLTRGLIELHGGSFEFDSEKGKGSTVTVRFPPDRTVHRS